MSTLVTTALRHNASASNNMVLDSNGRVGVGTATPATNLDVLGVARVGNGSSTGGVLRVTSTGQYADVLAATTNVLSAFFSDDVNSYGVVGTVTGHPLVFFTQNGERARIDVSGRFTVSSQPSFRVSRSNNTAVSGIVLFDNIYHNIGSHYNSANGRFTAPVTGNYLFMATGGNNSSFIFDIRVNQTVITRAEFILSSFQYIWQTAAVVVRMNANDFADVNVASGAVNFEPSLGSFTGYLLS